MIMIDSHSHIYLDEFSEDLPEVIARARKVGVSHILLPNIDSTTIQAMLQVADAYNGYCYPMIGLHPTSVNETYKKELAVVEKELSYCSDRYIGVGEIGLDLYWDKTYINQQIDAFKTQIEWALTHNMPVVIHSREAFDVLYETMLPYKKLPLKGIFHSFTGTVGEAGKLLEFENFLLGINGVATFKNAGLAEVLPAIPLERIALETDAPYLTPVPYRGKRNESAYLTYTLTKIAGMYRISPEEVALQTSENTRRVFEKLG